MSSTPIVAVSVLLATAAATAVAFLFRPPATETAPGGDATAALHREVAALQKTQSELRQQLDALAKAATPAPVERPVERVEAPTVSSEQVAAAVEAYLSKRAAGADSPAGGAAAPAFDMERDFAKLAGTSVFENGDLWRKAHAAGQMDELIKKFEALAKASPNDPKVQMDLAKAYISYLQLDSSKAPQLSLKADRVYDTVLELEPTHWEARFSKAVSYSFWPAFTGKPKESIKHFEMLVEQQDSMPVTAEQAQTYIMLGNMLEQGGNSAKAKAVWARGAKRHPDNAELVKKAGG